MCGGPGTRLDTEIEKPLLDVAGRPTIDRVFDALAESNVEQVYPVVSPHTPNTREHVTAEYDLIETPGDGYVADIGEALADDRVERPVVTVVADLPLLGAGHVNLALRSYRGRHLTLYVPAALKTVLGLSVDTIRSDTAHELSPSGLNIVGTNDGEPSRTDGIAPSTDGVAGQLDGEDDCEDRPLSIPKRESPLTIDRTSTEDLLISYDARLAVNVNRSTDARIAEVLADGP